MKVQIKRVKRGTCYNYDRLDSRFVDGSIFRFPEIGEQLVVQYNRPDLGSWITTPIIEIKAKKAILVIKTKNSIYHLKKGWKGEKYVEETNGTR